MQKDFLIVQFSIFHHNHNSPCDSSCVNILNNFQRTKAIICFNLCLSPNIAIFTHPIHPRGFVDITRQRHMQNFLWDHMWTQNTHLDRIYIGFIALIRVHGIHLCLGFVFK